jgi:hypothetical protein
MTVIQQYKTCLLDLIPTMTKKKKRWLFIGFMIGSTAFNLVTIFLLTLWHVTGKVGP